ncbi:gliding motility lipoprotein GldH [Polaribacter sp. WD7]|uniref:gliding motility lipoprotein GldH n=1 Tax=Polaribacter sp. WD7 TaxID=2269061 RepID=UPI000DF1B775|nr:gliding motility lipoprotein GldH [Polaribacter sp. WD7]RCS26204.1 gliding motility lipoprotein GldH [Polaribacter sp. WD7]
MATVQKNNLFFIFFGFLFLIFSCDDKIDFNQYKPINAKGWKANENVFFEFEVTDTISQKNLFINIRNNSDYEFSNLYLITALNFPDATVVIDTLQYQMADETGQYLGTGITEIKDNKLFYKEKKTFSVAGKYKFSVRHAMRKNGAINPIEFLKGIQDVGLSIEKIE